MDWLGWFKNDLKDLSEGDNTNTREIDSLVKNYSKRAKNAGSLLSKELERQKRKREEKKRIKKFWRYYK